MRRLAGVLAASAVAGLGACSQPTKSEAAAPPETAAATGPIEGQPMKIVGRFDAEMKKGEMLDLADLSGVACELEVDGSRRCLFVSDENSFAQFATIQGDTITPDKAAKPVLAASGKVIGEEPKKPEGADPPVTGPAACVTPKEAKAEADGEGVAVAGTTYYVVGSHGCSRKNGEWRPRQMQLYRLKPGGAVEATWQLNVALEAAAGDIAQHYRRKLAPKDEGAKMKDLPSDTFDGLTIEGLAADQDTVWVGLRAPAAGGAAYLVSANEKALFDDNATKLDLKPTVQALKLGKGIGVRDLTWLAPRQLLVLAGPAQGWRIDPDFTYRIHLVDLSAGCRIGLLAELKPFDGTLDKDDEKDGLKRVQAKAEGLAVLGGALGDLKLMVTYDKANQGMPRLYSVVTRPTLKDCAA